MKKKARWVVNKYRAGGTGTGSGPVADHLQYVLKN